jgi:hypothetical protein
LINLADIVEAIRNNRIRITDHADEEAVADRVSIHQVLTSIQEARSSNNQDDTPYPSCLVFSDSEGPLHSVWAYNEDTSWAVLITVYRPDPQRWINWRARRPKA